MATRRSHSALWISGALTAAGLVSAGMAWGQTLDEALARAYLSNPVLSGARATLRAVDEGVPQARAQSRPSAALTGSAGQTDTHAGATGYSEAGSAVSNYPNKWYPTNPRTVGVAVTQPLYKGGGIDAGIEQAEAAVLAQRAALLDTEQTVLLQAAAAYLDVIQAQALLELQVNFETVQKRDLDAFRGRFGAGEVTRTDVALHEAQVASASAARTAAEGSLAAAKAAFAKLVGAPPGKLTLPRLSYPLPASLDEAVAQARGRSPKVVNAVHSESAAKAAVDVADSGLLPSVSLTASALHNLDTTKRNDFRTVGSLIATLSIPLDGGALAAKARAARQTANAARIAVEQTSRTAEESAITSWQSLATARASIASYQAAVKANELAAEGMRQQVAVGSSTVIDMLNTQQTLLNARVNLVRARHDESVSIFALLASVGELTAQTLKLPVQYYDYEAHYRNVRGRWYGYGIDE
ncbi:MAG: TolC family outer membrane protein [Rhodospirillaceae bacterium]